MNQRSRKLLPSRLCNFFKVIYSIFWLTRITITIPILLAGICAFILCNSLTYSLNSILLILIPCLVAASGFILNDIVDVEKDKINRSDRPLPSNSISLRMAYILFFILFFSSIILMIRINDPKVFYLFLLATILTMSYSAINKYNGVLGNIVTAMLSIGPWLAPALYTHQLNVVVVPALASFCLIFSREILLDIKDMPGDRISQFQTLPVLFGSSFASIISFIIMVITNIIVITYGVIHEYSIWYFLLIFVGFIIPSVLLLKFIVTKKLTDNIDMICNIGKLQFIIGLICLVVK